MKIPVFVSCPTYLNPDQEFARTLVLDELGALSLEPRALGRSDYPTELPLREVYLLGTHCSGGVILGFEQFYTKVGIAKRGSTNEETIDSEIAFPTAWNHLESGILYALGLPLLVFHDVNIAGGIFDNGVTDVFVNSMPKSDISNGDHKELKEVFLKWQSNVRNHYYTDRRMLR